MNLEEIKVATIEQVEKRMNEIRSMDLDKVEDISTLDKEVDALKERKEELRNKAKEKQEFRRKIADGEIEGRTIKKPNQEERKMELTKDNVLSSKEYRNGFLKRLQGKELNAEERSAIALAGADPVVPEQMQQTIINKVKEYAPILNDITLLNVNGAVKFAVEGTNNSAEVHTENAQITPSSDTLVEVLLSTYEITKMIQISDSVKTMSISSFESWLTDMLVESIAMKVENLVFNGTGTGQAKGVNKLTWDTTNSVTVAKASSLTSANVYSLFGKIKEKSLKFYMNRLTLFTDFMPLMDNSKNHLVQFANGKYYILGAEVVLTDSVSDNEAILGNFKKYVGNLAEAVNVKSSYDINTNSYKYLGVALFDGKPAVAESFVKLVKASA